MLEHDSVGKIEKTDVILVISASAFLYLIFFRLPYYPFYDEADHLIFLENAVRMIGGEIIYKDFFQFTFPGAQSLYYLLFRLYGTWYWTHGVLAVLTGTLSYWLILRISKRLISKPLAYLPPTIFIFFGFRWFSLNAGAHWTMSALFVWLAVWMLIKKTDQLSIVLAGAVCGISSFFSQQRGLFALMGLGVFLGIEMVVSDWKWRTFFLREAILVSSFSIVLLILLSGFIISAGFSNFIWSTFTYPANYYHYFEYNNPGAFLVSLRNAFNAPHPYISEFVPGVFYSLVTPGALILFLLLMWLKHRDFEWATLRGPVLLASVGAVLIFTQTNNPISARTFQISVPSLVLSAWMFDLWKASNKHKSLLVKTAMCGLLCIGFLLTLYFQLRTDYTFMELPRGTVYMSPALLPQKYSWIAEHTTPADYILEAPQPNVSFIMDLKNCCKYAQFFPTEYTRPEFVIQTVDDLKATRPQLVIWENDYMKDPAESQPGDHLGPLTDLIRNDYEPIGPEFMTGTKQKRIWIRKPISAN